MSEEVIAEPEAELSLGQQLNAARVAASLSLDDVANTLHISLSILNAIENDSLDKSMNPLFSKGYIKSYAGLLKLDKERLVSLYTTQYSDDVVVKKMQSFSNRTKLKEHNNYLNYATWLIVLFFGATVVVWWYQQQNQALDLSPKTTDSSVMDTTSEEIALSVATDEVKTAEPMIESAVFSFSNDCWIKVTDASNEVIAIGIKKQGTSLRVSGVPPFEVNLGAADAVTIRYQDSLLDITPYTKGNTALFSVPLDK